LAAKDLRLVGGDNEVREIGTKLRREGRAAFEPVLTFDKLLDIVMSALFLEPLLAVSYDAEINVVRPFASSSSPFFISFSVLRRSSRAYNYPVSRLVQP